MKIGILGAGNVGSGLAAAAVKAGHEVTLSARDGEALAKAAIDTGARAATSAADAVNGAEVVVLAVPHGAVASIVAELGDVIAAKTVIDATNPLNDSYSDLTTSGVSAAETLQQQVPTASVVKAFNTIFASRHGNPAEGGVPLDAFVAGDDAAAKSKVGQLAESLGYRVIDAGGLRMARSLEEMAFLNISLNASNGWSWQSGWKLVGPTVAA